MTTASDTADAITMSIIVVSYNTKEMTLACLRSVVKETTRHPWELLFIDNCSTDGSLEAVEEEFGDDPRFRIRKSTENLGFAGGNNELAKEARGRYLLLLNPDTVVLDGALDKLVDFAESHPEHRIWGGRTIFEDGTLNPWSCWGPYTLWSIFSASIGLRAIFPRSAVFDPRSYGGWQRDTVREVAIVTGCLFLIDRSAWEQLGGFDSEFFMYGEETDLCMRATREFGARPIITPDATIIHHGGASEKIFEDKVIRLLDAEVRLFRRNFSTLKFMIAYRMTLFGVWFRATGYAMLNTIRGRKEQAVWRGIWKRRAEWAN